MASQYWPNISRQDIANANFGNGNPILSQCGLTREHQRQYRANGKPTLGQYIHVVWVHISTEEESRKSLKVRVTFEQI